MVATQKVTTDRVLRVSIEPYDQVFALTQTLINNGLKTSFNILTGRKKTSLLNKPFQCYQRSIGRIRDAVIEYPRIIVEAGMEENLSGVYYAMCFSKGSIKIEYDIMDAEGNPTDSAEVDQDLKGWKLAFRLQLGLDVVERQSDTFKELLGDSIKAGQYTLNELSAKFDTAEFSKKCFEVSEFGGFKWDSVPDEARENFMTLMTKQKGTFLKALEDAKTIGYALKTTVAQEKHKLTFEPNKIQYQTYPWLDPGAIRGKPARGLTGVARLNYLLYCETTGTNHELPPIDKRMLARRGNWTDGVMSADANSEATEFGSFHMSSRNFLQGYLLKQLRALNRVLEPTMTDVKCHIGFWTDTRCDYTVDLKVGDTRGKSNDDAYYDFKRVSDTCYGFESDFKPGHFFCKSGGRGWASRVDADAQCATKNTLSFDPGTDIITVTGESSISLTFFYQEASPLMQLNNFLATNPSYDIRRLEELSWRVTWSLQLGLEAVKDGGLQISSKFEGPKVEKLKDTAYTLAEYRNYTENAIANGISNMDSLRKKLAEDLEGQQGLCLPAGGVFFFKNPILNYKGDLIVSLAYNDSVPPAKMLDPNDSTVVNNSGNDRLSIAGGNMSAAPEPPGAQKVPLKQESG